MYIEQALQEAINISPIGKKITVKVLDKVDGELCHNLDGSRWLVEVTQNELIDNQGYQYQYDVLGLDDLCGIADYFESI